MLVCQPAIKNLSWLKNNTINRSIYKFYLTQRLLATIPNNMYKKWEDIFDCPIPWNQVFGLLYKTTVDAFTRYFQIKIIYNFLATK